MEKIDINKETLRGYTLLNRIESMAKMARLASTNINANFNDNNTLKIEDFEEIFKNIEELADEATTVISNLEAVKD